MSHGQWAPHPTQQDVLVEFSESPTWNLDQRFRILETKLSRNQYWGKITDRDHGNLMLQGLKYKSRNQTRPDLTLASLNTQLLFLFMTDWTGLLCWVTMFYSAFELFDGLKPKESASNPLQVREAIPYKSYVFTHRIKRGEGGGEAGGSQV